MSRGFRAGVPGPAAAIRAGLYDWAMTAGARAQAGLEITSPANTRVKHLVALRHRRARDRAGVTLVEGFEELGLALAAGGAVPPGASPWDWPGW